MSPGRAYALFALVCLIFSTTWLAIRIGLDDFRPLGLSLSMFTVPFALIYFAELPVPSGLAAVLFAAHAIFVALLAHFVLRDEPLTSARVAGILIGFAGVIVVFWERRSGHHTWLGEAAILACAAIQAVSSVVVRRTQRALDPVVLSAIGCAVGSVCLLGASFLFEGGPVIRLSAAGVLAILYLAIFGSVIAFSLTIHLIHVLGSNRVAMTVYVTPIAALVWGHLFRGETLGPRLFLGTVLVVGGVWLASRVDLKAAPVDAPAASAAAGGD